MKVATTRHTVKLAILDNTGTRVITPARVNVCHALILTNVKNVSLEDMDKRVLGHVLWVVRMGCASSRTGHVNVDLVLTVRDVHAVPQIHLESFLIAYLVQRSVKHARE